MKHIVCFHLLNDYSGSPKVLQLVLKGLLDNGYRIDLYTSDGGVLDELVSYGNLRKHTVRYHFSSNRALTLFYFFKAQLVMFLLSFRYMFDRQTVFYINTVLPFGAATAGWLMRKRVVYHCHEYILKKGVTYRMLGFVMQHIATEIICVSDDQKNSIKRVRNVHVIPNGISDEVSQRLSSRATDPIEQKTVLMLTSLKSYKGIAEFVQIAGILPQYEFVLVVNDTKSNIDSFFKEQCLHFLSNLHVFPRQSDIVPFYNRSSLVLNLSDKNRFIETSGLTVIEAIVAGLPVIVPTVGGVKEIVTDGINGYKIDSNKVTLIAERINRLLSHRDEYDKMRNNAKSMSSQFRATHVVNDIISVLNI